MSNLEKQVESLVVCLEKQVAIFYRNYKNIQAQFFCNTLLLLNNTKQVQKNVVQFNKLYNIKKITVISNK